MLLEASCCTVHRFACRVLQIMHYQTQPHAHCFSCIGAARRGGGALRGDDRSNDARAPVPAGHVQLHADSGLAGRASFHL